MSKLTLKNLTTRYHAKKQAVTDFCLETQDKEFVVLMGPSGAGKSTTGKMIAGLIPVECGDVYINNELNTELDWRERKVSMIFRNSLFQKHLTIYENLASELKLRRNWRDDLTSIDARVLETAELLGLTEKLNHHARMLSPELQIRLILAKAMVIKPDVIIFDEILSHTDRRTHDIMLTELEKFHKDFGVTTIHITHDMTEAKRLADRIVVLRDGKIQQIGTFKELELNPANKFVENFIKNPNSIFIDNVTLIDQSSRIYLTNAAGFAYEVPGDIIERFNDLHKYLNTDAKLILSMSPAAVRIFDAQTEETVLRDSTATNVVKKWS